MSAVLSECGKYRYRLERVLGGDGFVLVFIMLNPSTADATRDDPTIRKCVGFARLWGASKIIVVNLFAYRATDPRHLFMARCSGEDVVGPDNNQHIRLALEQSDSAVVAWGRNVEDWTWSLEQQAFVGKWANLQCLGTTKGGSPRHPLMVPYRQELQDWVGMGLP